MKYGRSQHTFIFFYYFFCFLATNGQATTERSCDDKTVKVTTKRSSDNQTVEWRPNGLRVQSFSKILPQAPRWAPVVCTEIGAMRGVDRFRLWGLEKSSCWIRTSWNRLKESKNGFNDYGWTRWRDSYVPQMGIKPIVILQRWDHKCLDESM